MTRRPGIAHHICDVPVHAGPHRSVPRAIVGRVAVAGLLGMLFLIALTFAINDIPRVTATDSPVAMILRPARSGYGEDVLVAITEETALDDIVS
jgi:amino acid transporter